MPEFMASSHPDRQIIVGVRFRLLTVLVSLETTIDLDNLGVNEGCLIAAKP